MVIHTKKHRPKGRKPCKRSKKGSQKGGGDKANAAMELINDNINVLDQAKQFKILNMIIEIDEDKENQDVNIKDDVLEVYKKIIAEKNEIIKNKKGKFDENTWKKIKTDTRIKKKEYIKYKINELKNKFDSKFCNNQYKSYENYLNGVRIKEYLKEISFDYKIEEFVSDNYLNKLKNKVFENEKYKGLIVLTKNVSSLIPALTIYERENDYINTVDLQCIPILEENKFIDQIEKLVESTPPPIKIRQPAMNIKTAASRKAAAAQKAVELRKAAAKRKAAARPTFPGSTRPNNRRNNNKAIKPAKYVFVFDYDHTLTNSYGKTINVNGKLVSITHSMGRSYNGEGLFTKSGKPSEGLYNSSDMTRGTYNELLEQLSYFKENGVLMFVNSRGIQSQLLQRLRDDNLLQYFGISDEEGADEKITSGFIASGNIDKGVYGAITDAGIGSGVAGAEKWGHLKVEVIKDILEKLTEKNMIDADTEVHFFDDEPDNVKKFNSHFNPQMEEFNNNEKSVNTKYKGHNIGNRGGAGKPSITEKLEMMNIALKYETKNSVKVNIIDRINKEGYNIHSADDEAKLSKKPLIIIRNSSQGGYAYDVVKNNEQKLTHFRDINYVRKFLLENAKTSRIGVEGGSRKQRKTKKSSKKSSRKSTKKSTKKQRKHKKKTKKTLNR